MLKRRFPYAIAGFIGSVLLVAAAAAVVTAASTSQARKVIYIPDIQAIGPEPTATVTPTPTATPPQNRHTDRAQPGAEQGEAQGKGHGAGVAALSDAPQGIEGWGSSVLSLQNRSANPNSASVELVPNIDSGLTLSRALDSYGHTVLDLQAIDGVFQAFYHGIINSDYDLGAIVKTRWGPGGYAAFEPSEPSDELIIPLFAKNVGTLTTLLYGLYPAGSAEDNLVRFDFYDATTGDTVLSTSFHLDAGDSTSWDPAFDPVFEDLGESFLGSVHVSAEEPVALQAYGDEAGAAGAFAYQARPTYAAATVQILPLVRSGEEGNSIVAVANPGRNTITVQATFTGAETSPSGAGQAYSTSFEIAPAGTALLDLGGGSRGNVERPTGLPRRFVGGLSLVASHPILAAVYDAGSVGGLNAVSTAYNAFGPDEMATRWAVPDIPRASGAAGIAIMNPGETPADVSVLFRGDGNAPLGTTAVTLAPGGVRMLSPQSAGAAGSGRASAIIEASQPIAVIVIEDDVGGAQGQPGGGDRAAYRAVSLVVGTIDPTPTASAEPSPSPTSRSQPTASATKPGPEATVLLPWAGQR